MAERQVCNINFYLYMTFLFGFNHNFGHSPRTRWLATAYCLIVCLPITIGLYFYSVTQSTKNMFLMLLLSTEYLAYVFVSMIKKNDYLQRYYKRLKIIDDVPNAALYKKLFKWLLFNVILTIFCKLSMHFLIYYIYWDFIVHFSILRTSFEVVIYVVAICGRLPPVFVFSLLYCRVRYMKTTLERNQFNCTSQGDHHPRRYIQMYETIMDTFEDTEGVIKTRLFIFYMVSVPYYVCIYAGLLQSAKNQTLSTLSAFWMVSDVISTYLPIIVSATLADLVSQDVQDMLGTVLERCIQSNNERDYAEIQKLFEYMKSRPFNYTVWRVMPLSVRSLLAFMSFWMTTVIAVLQIKDRFV